MEPETVVVNKKDCRALCRDGSACLNHARIGDYCWRHTRKLQISSDESLLSLRLK